MKKIKIKNTVKEFRDILNMFPELNKDVRENLLFRLEVRLGEFWDYGRLELDEEIKSIQK